MITASIAFAANDGTAGNNSTGDMNVSITKGNEVRISNLQDVDFGGQRNTQVIASSTSAFTLRREDTMSQQLQMPEVEMLSEWQMEIILSLSLMIWNGPE